jgi:hypothetical protein
MVAATPVRPSFIHPVLWLPEMHSNYLLHQQWIVKRPGTQSLQALQTEKGKDPSFPLSTLPTQTDTSHILAHPDFLQDSIQSALKTQRAMHLGLSDIFS